MSSAQPDDSSPSALAAPLTDSTSSTRGPFAAAIYGRLDAGTGWTRLQRSSEPATEALEEERRWLAIDWIQSCPILEDFIGALGHFRSRIEPDLFHLYEVAPSPGLRQPARALVTLHRSDYERLCFDPFAARAAGLFAFAAPFRAHPETGVCAAARFDPSVPAGASVQLEGEERAQAERLLEAVRGSGSALLRASCQTPGCATVFRAAVEALTPDERAGLTISSFVFADEQTIRGTGELFACVYSPSAPPSPVVDARAALPVEPPMPSRVRFAPTPTDPPAARTPPLLDAATLSLVRRIVREELESAQPAREASHSAAGEVLGSHNAGGWLCLALAALNGFLFGLLLPRLLA